MYMFDANHSVVGLASRHELVSDEKKLQYLVTAFRERLTQLRGLTDWDSQFRFSSKRKIDVLALRPRRKQLVGIELKTSALDHRAGGQLLDYVDDLAKLAKARGLNSAHLIVVSGQPDPVVRSRVEAHAKTRKVTVEFLLYRVEMKLIPHP
ncbi:hypothetical protein A5643_14665 [Mycobacterium sp. 1274756.6]|nr:hypothetical protein A5643_14665 [Mycobacterium sp. 1274756.6]